MLIAIIFIFYEYGTLDVTKLLILDIDKNYQNYLWLGFCIIAVKTPMWPFHTWLPDACQAPTSGSVILAAILLKMAGYGFIRFSIGLFPHACLYFAPLIFILSIIAIVTSLVALMQKDTEKIVPIPLLRIWDL